MALEAAALYQQELFGHTYGKDLHPLLLESLSLCGTDFLPTSFKDQEQDYANVSFHGCYFSDNQSDQCDWHSHYYNENHISPPPTLLVASPTLNGHEWGLNSSPDEPNKDALPMEVSVRPKRRRTRPKKNMEDIENQRMTHIAVERNRRKQMNEYLNALRSLMPDSYVTRGDQASIVGGAINFVKELEQNLQSLSGTKQTKVKLNNKGCSSTSLPFEEFFTFPQYSSQLLGKGRTCDGLTADVEVTMVESHANLKIRLKQTPKQLSKLVSGLLCLRLTILHLNVNTADGVVLYSLSLKVEDDSNLSTVEEIASAVYQLLGRIQVNQATFIC